MIEIVKKEDCCGCKGCSQICPKQCISMYEDVEGFLYPKVDKEACIDCHLCEKVCPVLHQGEPRKTQRVYAAKNMDDEIRVASSSGGVFTLLAELVIESGGVVFGARFNDRWEVIHDYTETKEGLTVFRGSKYVQSYIGDCFGIAKTFLESGRKVLFSGTPCQIAGLKLFLRKEYANLLTVDFICHGVPSPKIWRMYLNETISRQCEKFHSSDGKGILIEDVSFRNKCSGWKKFSFTLTFSRFKGNGLKKSISLSEVFKKNIFMKGFLSNLYLRPSCYSCPSKGFKSGSDVTLGDFWGSEKILPFFDDDLGISVVMVNSNNGNFYMENVRDRLALYQVWTEDVLCHNSCLVESVVPHINRHDFFSDYEKGVLVAMGKQFKQSFVHNVIFKIVSTSKRIIGK